MFQGRNYEQRKQQCFSPILVSDLKSNVILRNILYCIDYAIITMFTITEVNIVCTRFVQRFLRFPRPQTAQNNSQKLRLKSRSLLYTYNPASKAILQKRKPRSNYHIIEIMCCLCIFYDGLIISGKRLLWNLFLRSIY